MRGKEFRRRTRAITLKSLPIALRWIPTSWGRRFCRWAGGCGYWLVPRDRGLAEKNLSRVFPEWGPEQVQRMAKRVFQEIGTNAFDFVRYPDLPDAQKDDLVTFSGIGHLEELRSSGQGAIVVTGHLGCWEVLAAALVRIGMPLRPLARPLREPRLEELLRRHRLAMGVETFSTLPPPVQAIRHVSSGGFLGVLVDQRVKERGIVVDFLGQPTRMTEAPARLSVASGSPLVPVGVRRLSDQTHLVSVLPPIPSGSGDIQGLTQQVAEALDGLIRAAPEQWMWIHPRWEGRSPVMAPGVVVEEVCK